jgi:hypothetical protein
MYRVFFISGVPHFGVEVLAAVTAEITVFCDVAPCCPIYIDLVLRSFRY